MRIAIAIAHSNGRTWFTNSDRFTHSQPRSECHAVALANAHTDPLMDVARPAGELRHSPRTEFVKRTMTYLRAAMPFIRAVILAGVAIYLILFGLPAVLGIAAAAAP